MAGNFLEQIKRAREAAQASAPEQAPTKPTEQMADDEIQEALNKARRDLLDAQHQELREREIARASASGSPAPDTTLADVLRQRQTKKRRTWR
jgi:hypothetical protein